MLDPYFLLFPSLNILELIKNLLDMLIRNAYNPHSLLYVELMRFGLLYNRPTEPFLKHLLDMHEHIGELEFDVTILSRLQNRTWDFHLIRLLLIYNIKWSLRLI